MTGHVPADPCRGPFTCVLLGLPLLGAILPYVLGIVVYRTTGGNAWGEPYFDSWMAVGNAMPFTAVALLGLLGQGPGLRILTAGAAAVGVLLGMQLVVAPTWLASLIVAGVIAICVTTWRGDVVARRAGLVGSALGVLAANIQSNIELWHTLFSRSPGFSMWPVGLVFTLITDVLMGLPTGFLCGVLAVWLFSFASRKPSLAG
jgi:hypothetical protein